MDWIRARDLPSHYPIGKTYAYELINAYMQDSDDWIKDGRVLIVKKETFERWWQERSQRQKKKSRQSAQR